MKTVPSPPTFDKRVVAALKPASNQQLRNKFFNMIGIEARHRPALFSHGTPSSSPPSANNRFPVQRSPRSKVATFTESLKYDVEADRNFTSPVKRRKTDAGKPQPRKQLGFIETVKVVPIPMRTEYSNRVRQRLWSNALEIHENATRNTVEFASEGWDWRSVIEDEAMYVCVSTGDLVHPCHYEEDFAAQR